jgi:N-acyl-D-aspartate/D-glutamate deacylase
VEYRRRHNDYYSTLTARGCRNPVGIVTRADIETAPWLGIADRVVVRQLDDAESVLLDIESWRNTLLDSYQRIPAGTYMVGAKLRDGVVGVMDGQKPMLRHVKGERDRLGREVVQEVVEPTPWYMRTLG